ncbi:MAG: two component, sigma54 specific, transcriptional regulator, Fis family [Myxococcales bacterium]|nr:two component, sigma54 specific, transcriptional regulator, Fis family [Myxococcales bacterium]
MPRPRIVLADDELNLRKVLGTILARDGYEVLEARDGEEALRLVDQHASAVAAVITDLRMPRLDGMGLLRRVVADHPDIPVIMITAHGSVDSAVEAVKLGAFDYIEKPFEQTQIQEVVAKAIKTHELDKRAPRAQLAQPPGAPGGRFGLIGRSPVLELVFSVIEKVADTPSTVLISGESGTGKELIARALHANSSRKNGPFIKINCAAIPKTLMESELFGYEKGAFTGAVGSKPGRFELADGGTLFLDEIGEIPVEMQVKLLRVLQESEFERVGGIKTIKVDVRLVTATNRDLQKEVTAGAFRDDLFYRLNVVPIHLPPLRERTGDIPSLVSHFISRFNERLKKQIAGIDDEALARLMAHPWPGNIRELENVMERTILFCEGPRIHASDLPPEFVGNAGTTVTAAAAAAASSLVTQASMPPGATPAFGTPMPPAGPAGEGRASSLKELVRQETERVERELIVRALEETGGNVTQAARKLKISRKSLQNKMKEFGLRDRE